MENNQNTTNPAAINMNDLQILLNIIDICTKRGAFEGGELLPVGQIREKLAAFVRANAQAQTQTSPADNAEESATE